MPLKIDYDALFAAAKINQERLPEIETIVYAIQNNRASYWKVEAAAKIPWFVVAAIHNLESSLNFKCHLHNGDPLTHRTVHVPKGRPFAPPASGHLPYTWEESAIDALAKSELWRPTMASNWTLAQCLEFMERYNGLGYYERDINTPYLWSGTNLYTKGLFVRDDKFDPNAVSQQIGAVAIFKTMLRMGMIQLVKGDFL